MLNSKNTFQMWVDKLPFQKWCNAFQSSHFSNNISATFSAALFVKYYLSFYKHMFSKTCLVLTTLSAKFVTTSIKTKKLRFVRKDLFTKNLSHKFRQLELSSKILKYANLWSPQVIIILVGEITRRVNI